MKILIVGGGGREHALAWKLAQSSKIDKLYCVPGNAGIAQIAECVPIKAEAIQEICTFAKSKSIDLVVVGPELPLSLGLVDQLEGLGIKVFGPNKKCAQIEGSKAFTKAFLTRHNIPTARYKEFTCKEEIKKAVGIFAYPMVLKADGLAGGKGVIIAENQQEALNAIEEMMGDKVFGRAGEKIVVEEFLTGIEASMLCFVDGKTILPMESAQDYKRILDDDKGPNTGGMGTYSPSLIFTKELEEQIKDRILNPTIEGFQKDGLDFKGVLFIGLMITKEGPKVIEFNNRFGDPETQSILPRMETDLLEIIEAVIEGRLEAQEIKWNNKKAVCIIMASGGYPGIYQKGKPIMGLNNVEKDILLFHSGTSMEDDQILTDGGRVLAITALGSTHEEARNKAYENVKRIQFEGMQYRKDIGSIHKNK